MNKQTIIRKIQDMLRDNFPLEEIQSLRKMRDQGMLLDVLDDAIDGAIEGIVTERFQNLELDQ